MRTESEKRCPPTLVKTPQTLSSKSAHKTVSDTAVEQASSGSVCALVVEPRRHNVEWSHHQYDCYTTCHAGGKCIQPAGRRKQLQGAHKMTTNSSALQRNDTRKWTYPHTCFIIDNWLSFCLEKCDSEHLMLPLTVISSILVDFDNFALSSLEYTYVDTYSKKLRHRATVQNWSSVSLSSSQDNTNVMHHIAW